jgi:nucleotide-binding universal stress UspA family protein
MIVAHATACDFDLIVMGTHGRTGLSHFLLGSVTERVLRTAACPVLTIKLPGEPRPSATEAAFAHVQI